MNILEHYEHILNYFQLSLAFRVVYYMKMIIIIIITTTNL